MPEALEIAAGRDQAREVTFFVLQQGDPYSISPHRIKGHRGTFDDPHFFCPGDGLVQEVDGGFARVACATHNCTYTQNVVSTVVVRNPTFKGDTLQGPAR